MTKTLEAKSPETIGVPMNQEAFTSTYNLTMTPEQWQTVPSNPRQRDTKRHLRRAHHLYSQSPTHAHVAMAQAPDGSRWKLDGHTRALLWSQQPHLAPEAVSVTVYIVEDEEEAKELYTHFDAKEALETAADKVSGAFHEICWTPSSTFLQRGAIVSGLLYAQAIIEGATSGAVGAERRKDITTYVLVSLWEKELRELDTVSPAKERWNNACLAAAILTLRRRPAKALEFWRLYQMDAGVKLEDQVDGVEAAARITNAARLQGKKASLDRASAIRNVARYISCFESWNRRHIYKLPLSVKSTDLATYLKTKEEK